MQELSSFPPQSNGLSPDELEAIKAVTAATISLNSAIQHLSQVLQRRHQEQALLPLEEAAEQLVGVSRDMLLDRIRDGRFKYGVHYVNSSDGERPTYLVKLAAVRAWFDKPPEKRSLRTAK
ncbi:MAG TPA: hypothetical protein DCZ55_33835 [Cyanobacteria bacterium UBA11371]|nr:hypothetical protein [Cyanobacteria bacterium UBA11371]